MRHISFIVLAVILVSFFWPIVSANGCDLEGSWEIYEQDAKPENFL